MSHTGARAGLAQISKQALAEVLEALLGVRPAELESGTAASDEPIHGAVNLTGPRASGTLQLWVPRRFAEGASAQLVGEPSTLPHTGGLAADFVAELCNMVAGRVAARLGLAGYPCALGVPEVVRESAARTSSARTAADADPPAPGTPPHEPASPVGRGSAEPLRRSKMLGSTESRPTRFTDPLRDNPFGVSPAHGSPVGAASQRPSNAFEARPPTHLESHATDRCRSDWSCQGHHLTLEIHLCYRVT